MAINNTQRGSVIGISATKGAAILGLSSYQTQFEVWQGWIEKIHPGINKKLGYEMPKRAEGPALRWGKAFESAIIKLAEERQDREIALREAFVELGLFYKIPIQDYDMYNSHASALCYLDGVYKTENFRTEAPVTLHEAKTTNSIFYRENFGEPGTDRVPLIYQIQCQHQMLCTGAKETILSVLVFPDRVDEYEKIGVKPDEDKVGNIDKWLDGETIAKTIKTAEDIADVLGFLGKFHQYNIRANEDLQQLMLSKYRKWWNSYISGCKPPDPANADDFSRMYTEPVGTIILNEVEASYYREYKEIGKEISPKGVHGKNREALKLKILDVARKKDATIDDESRDKWIFRDETGKKLGSWNGKVFR